jgi:SPP1 family predicted phage head-tail adaptor
MPGLNANQRVAYKATGDRIKRVRLSRPTVTVDGMGGETQTWSEYGQAWAAITEQPFVVTETQATVLRIVEVPYRPDVAEGHRVSLGSQVWSVLAVVNPEQRNRALQLHCGVAVSA